MKTIEYLADPDLRQIFLPPVVVVVCMGVLCAITSVLVVLKRLAFVGQGISHAALGGVGVAAALGTLGGASAGVLGAQQFAIVVAFCAGAGLLIGWLTGEGGGSGTSGQGRAHVEADTAIGVVLVLAMSIGALLLQRFSRQGVSWESFLFGSVLGTDWAGARNAGLVTIACLSTLAVVRRRLVFWAFDPAAARASGVRTGLLRAGLMLLLSITTVTAMQLAGVVLATALLVMPGAIALTLCTRWRGTIVLSVLVALVGGLGGLVLSFEFDWLPGASIVCVLGVLYALALGTRWLTARASASRG